MSPNIFDRRLFPVGPLSSAMTPAAAQDQTEETTVTVKCTGRVRDAVGTPSMDYSFAGNTLADFLDAFLEEYDVADLLLASEEADASAPGWAPVPDSLPGTWNKNPDDEQVRRFARVLVNGRFNEHLEGFDTQLTDGDRVSLMYPFVYCV